MKIIIREQETYDGLTDRLVESGRGTRADLFLMSHHLRATLSEQHNFLPLNRARLCCSVSLGGAKNPTIQFCCLLLCSKRELTDL
jgi:hypothetical protein